jgi:hypothetical protein
MRGSTIHFLLSHNTSTIRFLVHNYFLLILMFFPGKGFVVQQSTSSISILLMVVLTSHTLQLKMICLFCKVGLVYLKTQIKLREVIMVNLNKQPNLVTPETSHLLLGDLITDVLSVLGVKQVVDFISKKTGEDCGCKKRAEELNEVGRKLTNHFMRHKKDVNL